MILVWAMPSTFSSPSNRDGRRPSEERYYQKVSDDIAQGNHYVGWGGVSNKQMNEWVTVDALFVLAETQVPVRN